MEFKRTNVNEVVMCVQMWCKGFRGRRGGLEAALVVQKKYDGVRSDKMDLGAL